MNKNISCDFGIMKLHVSLCFLLLVLAASTTAVPRITPNTPDITLSVGTERDLQCEDATSIGWYFAHQDRFVGLDAPNAVNVIETQKDEHHISTLDMSHELSSKHVGYYYCVEKALIEEPTNADTLQRLYERQQAARIYVYLDFPGIDLAVDDHASTLNAVIDETLTLPCLPTRKDVKVTLEHDEEPQSEYAFDPTEGFAMDNIRLHHAGDYICYYTRGDQLTEQMVVVRVSRSVRKPNRPIIHTSTKYVEESGEIRLSCKTKEPNLKFMWELPAKSTAEQELRVVTEMVSPMEKVLIVHNANLDTDTGEYTCIVTTATKNLSSKESIYITVYPPGKCHIKIKEPIDQYTITVNKREQSVMWGVDFDGHPSPLVADWFDVNNNRLLDNSSKFWISSQELSHGKSHAKFVIYDPVLADMGDYVMRVYHNDECQQNRTFRLIVEEAPIVELHSRTVRAGRDVHMSCIVVGYPESTIHWTWTECALDLPTPSARWSMEKRCPNRTVPKPIDEHALTVVRNEKFQNSTLSFHPSGPGRVTCSASNRMSPNSTPTTESAAVYVLDRDEPFITTVLPDVIAVGETAELRCLVEMYNFTENVRWQRHGVDIESTADGRLLVTTSQLEYMHSVVLQFSSIGAQDEGSYECVAIGFDGTAVSRTQGVVVHREQRPLFGNLTEVQAPLTTLQINERLELSCAPTGMPVPEVKWMRDDVLLQNDEHVILIPAPVDQIQFNHTLIVTKMNQSDEGKYECVAWNRLGEARYIFPVQLDALGPTKTTIALVIGLLILLLLTTCVGIFFYRREHKKWLLLKHAGISYFDNGDMSNYNPDLSRMEQADLLPYDRKYEFPRDRLRLTGVKLGAGAFGIVYKAQALGIVPDVAETTVAVKTIKNSDKDEDIKALISELKIMIHMGKHVNVVNLLGAVTRDIRKRSLYVITEFCDLGNLYHFLKKNRNHFVNQVTDVTDVINSDILTIQQQMHEEPDGPPTSTSYFQGSLGQDSDAQLLSVDSMRTSRRTTSSYTPAGGQYVPGAFQTITTTDLVCWSFQVARGMAYLAQRGVLHGDLAARNILLCSDKVVKICDFGLSRSLRPEEDYQKESDGPLPIKWLAIESISHKIFNTSTDVWSFGIVMWELFSMAQVPYADVPTEKMLSRLQEGHRMLRPKYATQALYELMRECWSVEPTQRPRFDVLARRLGEMLPSEVEQEFVDMNDQYMQVNIAEGRDKGDYLSVLLLPDTDAPAVPFGGPTLANVENGFADRSPDAEAIPMLTRSGRSTDGGDDEEPRRAMTPLARSDTDTDLDKTWQQQSAMANISPRRLPPQNSYVNLPATSPSSPPPPVPITAPSDAVSNLGYVMMNNNRT